MGVFDAKARRALVKFAMWLSKFAVASGLVIEEAEDNILIRGGHGAAFDKQASEELIQIFTLEIQRLGVAATVSSNDYGVVISFED
jgi:hypothetical protein